MATTSALETLVDLAKKDTDEATKRLGRTVRSCDEAQQKLDILKSYREDYAAKFQQNLETGLSPMAYRNFQLFIEKVDKAISGQQDVVFQAKDRVEQARLVWQKCEQKRLTFETLVKRNQKIKLAKENKQDQKLMDEYAARIAFYKK